MYCTSIYYIVYSVLYSSNMASYTLGISSTELSSPPHMIIQNHNQMYQLAIHMSDNGIV